jgi:hypothetical protein
MEGVNMRRPFTIILTTIALIAAGAGTASAARSATPADPPPPIGHGGWVFQPAGPVDIPAGRVCDFGVHLEPLVNEVRVKVVQTYPDGSPEQALADGALIYQVVNAESGQSMTADASGRAVFEFFTDGSALWRVVGPILAGLSEGASNLPRGLFIIDGVYTVGFSPTNFITVTLTNGSVHNLCDDLA